MYKRGEGVGENLKEAEKWYRKAAEQGDAEAQSYLGYMYSVGEEVEQDDKEAVKRYRVGEGIEQDDKEAVKWFRKAAEQGQVYAQSNLGLIYALGQGVEQDIKEALKWWRKAADQGDANSQFGLGLGYFFGLGVNKDLVTGFAWMVVAVKNEVKKFESCKKEIMDNERIAAEQIAKAEELAKEMIKKNPKLLNKQ